ncbi:MULTISPECIES: GMC family oxidoreductase N-terminal domain-containing protein [unclassified Mesorhizobium]|uniref:GMC family oxidoreductase n=1 Tax=unclassified Mesorhizobium TaxID=325217 RepID=UPI000FCCCCAF|nr:MULTISPECIES: GMC family oxidoreductase N-terminal domain-containing protein [unclassified Mesorhizobium]RVD31804.1 dehydrogenase [Mesorhizobium sp. M4B.F.Ca.ET.017.02.2.1]RWC97429.1 MAG: dehydrogenase [Mesorhizobium sp.]RWF67333.1 MAG: dehydrogenase [Mesorhizobium sp.]TIT44205.1 MAG: dehydrogenase [Mesorhizobium sp.]
MAETFDTVIVGAGTAGCVLADRLSLDQGRRVLLLEAGRWDWNPLIHIPYGARKMFDHSMFQWGDISDPDPTLDDHRQSVPHGKVIGGTGSLNFMAHVRGHPNDYRRWVEQGAKGWSYGEVLPFFKQCETWEGGENEWRGGSGPLGASKAKFVDPLPWAWFAAAKELGHPLTDDYNGQQNEGFGAIQYTIRNGRRSSPARAFLRPAMSRRNLTLRTGAHVTKVIFEGRRAVGVEYVKSGQRHVVRASERVALCLGAINTPHLLLLSGVGPADHLLASGIAPLADLPVGKSLEDHLAFPLLWRRKQPDPFHKSLRLDRIAVNMLRAHFLGTGPAAHLPGAIMAFLKSEAGLAQPDIQLVISMISPEANLWYPFINRPGTGSFGLKVNLLSQRSRGEVLLRSTNPLERPRIVYRSLEAPEDPATMRRGYHLAMALGEATAMAPMRAETILPPKPLKTDDEIDAFVRANSFQQYHPACTCRMGNDERSVLNADLSVKGFDALNVVDASAMPHLIGGNPNVVIMMMAARVAAMWQH